MTEPLRTRADYEAALAEVERLMHLERAPGTPEYERLARLAALVEQYEDAEWPMGDINPALNAEEWHLVELWAAGKLIGGRKPPGYSMYNPAARAEKKHALAAICLHGQAFGFTWEDIDALELVYRRVQRCPNHWATSWQRRRTRVRPGRPDSGAAPART